MARKTAEFRVTVPVPQNAEEMVLLVYKLEGISENEGIPLKSIGVSYEGMDESGYSTDLLWEFNYQSKI